MGFLTRSDKDSPVQSQEEARSLIVWIGLSIRETLKRKQWC